MNATQRLCLVLGDQLSFDLASQQGLDIESDTVLLVEVMEEASHVPHHPKNRSDIQCHATFRRGSPPAWSPSALRHVD